MRNWKSWVLAAFLAAAVAFGIFRWYVAGQLEAVQQRVRDAGYPLTYAELNAYYKEPPSGENRAYLLSFAMDAEVAAQPRILERLPIAGNADLPHRTEPIPEEHIKAMRAYFLQNLDAIDAVFESFAYDECRFPVDVNAGPAMMLDHLSRLRSLARIMSIAATLFTENGDTENAAKYLEGIFELGDSLESEPVFISQLVRIAIYGIGLEALQQSLNRVDFTAAELEQLQEKLIEVEANAAFKRGIVGERCIWKYLDRLGIGSNGISSMYNGPDLQDLWISVVYRPSGMMDLEGIRYYEMFEKLIEGYKLPIEQQRERAMAIEEETLREGGFGPITAIIMPAVGRMYDADVRNRTQLRMAIVALAAARYYADRGDYPDALVPDYLDAIPKDPYGGAPMRYRKLESGFVVYSLAENLIDDGGEEAERFIDGLQKGDLTFTVERKEATQ